MVAESFARPVCIVCWFILLFFVFAVDVGLLVLLVLLVLLLLLLMLFLLVVVFWLFFFLLRICHRF